jgi:sialate O-acetylesterase
MNPAENTVFFFRLLVLIYILRETNTKELEQEPKIVVACVGDSITFGSGAFDRNITAYPAILEELLGPSRFFVQNFGLGSATMLKTGIYIFNFYYIILLL